MARTVAARPTEADSKRAPALRQPDAEEQRTSIEVNRCRYAQCCRLLKSSYGCRVPSSLHVLVFLDDAECVAGGRPSDEQRQRSEAEDIVMTVAGPLRIESRVCTPFRA